jgi:predicted nucleic acid-binding protein
MGWLDLKVGSRIYLDTAPIIYIVEQVPEYQTVLHPILEKLAADEILLFSSELTLTEVLVMPLKNQNQALVNFYDRFLQAYVNLQPITISILRNAAQLRAIQNFKTPDAIHAATAEVAQCDLLITNDRAFSRLHTMPVVVLRDLIELQP